MTVADVAVPGHVGRLHGAQVAFCIGVHTLRFRSADPSVRFFVHELHEPFLVDPGSEADCEVEWSVGDVRPSEGPVVRRSGQRWDLRYLAGGVEEFAFRSTESNVPTLLLTMTP